MLQDDLNSKTVWETGSVTELLRQFPNLPARVIVTLAILSLAGRNVTPRRLCGCGCGAFVTGKATFASPACRKRAERERRAARGAGGRQFNLVWQDDLIPPKAVRCVPCSNSEFLAASVPQTAKHMKL